MATNSTWVAKTKRCPDGDYIPYWELRAGQHIGIVRRPNAKVEGMGACIGQHYVLVHSFDPSTNKVTPLWQAPEPYYSEHDAKAACEAKLAEVTP
jgi:hypothetical protein